MLHSDAPDATGASIAEFGDLPYRQIAIVCAY
jgi:hypothetical protein